MEQVIDEVEQAMKDMQQAIRDMEQAIKEANDCLEIGRIRQIERQAQNELLDKMIANTINELQQCK